MVARFNIAGSSSGRIRDSESRHLGSNPSPAALPETMFHIYILECADRSLYVGCTNNLERRVKQHNDSKSGAHYTKIRRPVKLLYSESFLTLREARHREREVKGWRREKKLNLIKNTS